MLLHEILKLPDIEFVVGLELDQQVARSTFKHAGVQPHFDDVRVEWWFGDASKSMMLLPSSYFGSFDVVIIDLITEVADGLMVTQDLSLLSASELLLHKDGIIIRNEEVSGCQDNDFAEYMVELTEEAIPIFCQAGMTIGSNSKNLLTVTPHNVSIETVALNIDEEPSDRWIHYRNNEGHTKRRCAEWATAEANIVKQKNLASSGILLITEIEQERTGDVMSGDEVKVSIRNALLTIGFTELSLFVWDGQQDENVSTYVAILNEGYLVVRSWPQHKYFGVDLQLWDKLDQANIAKAALMSSLGGQGETLSTATFRIVTSGMNGINEGISKVGPVVPADGICESHSEFDDGGDTSEVGWYSLLNTLDRIDGNHKVAVLCPPKPIQEHLCMAQGRRDKTVQSFLPSMLCSSQLKNSSHQQD